jgi:type I site-specific restriction-modification system R (restriction) subunit
MNVTAASSVKHISVLTSFFRNIQMFGFTGTPIFADNAVKNELGQKNYKGIVW